MKRLLGWTVVVLVWAVLVSLCVLLLNVNIFAAVEEEPAWRQLPGDATLARYAAYLSGCRACIHAQEAQAVYTAMQRQAGIVVRLDGVRAAVFSRDIPLVTAGEDSDLYLWDSTTGRSLRRQYHIALQANTLAYAAQSNLVAAGMDTGTLLLWDLDAIAGIKKPLTAASLETVAFAPDDQRLGWRTSDRAGVWVLATDTVLEFPHQTIEAIGFYDHGRLLTGSSDRIVHWDARRGVELQTVRLEGTGKLAGFSQPATTAWRLNATTLELWDTSTGQRQHTLHHPANVTAVCASDNSAMLAISTSSDTLHLWQVTPQEARETLRIASVTPGALTCARDGSRLLVSDRATKQATLWHVPTLRDWVAAGERYRPEPGHYTPSTAEQWIARFMDLALALQVERQVGSLSQSYQQGLGWQLGSVGALLLLGLLPFGVWRVMRWLCSIFWGLLRVIFRGLLD